MKRRATLRMTLLAALLIFYGVAAGAEEDKISAAVIEKAKSHGVVSVLVGLNVPWQREDTLNDDGILAQRQVIRAAQQALLTELGGTQHKVVREFQEIPGIALEIGSDAVAVLEKSATVTNVLEDRPAIVLGGDEHPTAPVSPPSEKRKAAGKIPVEIFESAKSGDTVLVLVGLKAPWRPEGVLAEALITAQRNAIAASQDYLLAELTNTSYRITHRFRRIPGIALEVGMDALRILDHSPAVTNVLKDRPAKPKN